MSLAGHFIPTGTYRQSQSPPAGSSCVQLIESSMKTSSDRRWPRRRGRLAGQKSSVLSISPILCSFFRLPGLGSCQHAGGWPVFLLGCSVGISGRIGMFTSPLSALLSLPTFQPEKALSLPGGPLSWFMTGLLSFIYQTQRVEDGCLISLPGTIDFELPA